MISGHVGTRRTVLLVVSPDIVEKRTANSGIRYLELSEAMVGAADVILSVPNDTSIDSHGVRLIRYDSEQSLRVLVENSDAAVVPAAFCKRASFLERSQTPIVVDLDDNLPPIAHAAIPIGDFFICGTERQRASWLGAFPDELRLTRHSSGHDRSLHRAIGVVGVGISRRATRRESSDWDRADVRLVVSGCGGGEGLHSLLRAWPYVAKHDPRARLVFVGESPPKPPLGWQTSLLSRPESLAPREDDESFSFFDSGDLDAYWRLLSAANVGVSLYAARDQTRSSYPHVVDYFAARLPVVVTKDHDAAVCATDGAVARIVDPEDEIDIASTIVDLLAQPKNAYRGAFDPVHEQHCWERVVDPLRLYCRNAVAEKRHRSRHLAPLYAPPNEPLVVRAFSVWRAEGARGVFDKSSYLIRRLSSR